MNAECAGNSIEFCAAIVFMTVCFKLYEKLSFFIFIYVVLFALVEIKCVRILDTRFDFLNTLGSVFMR